MSLLDWLRGCSWFCVYYYEVTYRQELPLSLAMPLQFAMATGDGWQTRTIERPGRMLWHQPHFVRDDAPPEMHAQTLVSGTISTSPMIRRVFRRSPELVLAHYAARAVVMDTENNNEVVGYLAGIARRQADADAWCLNGVSDRLERRQEIAR